MKTGRILAAIDFIIFITLINYAKSIESPEYRVVLRLDSDTEIRLYKESLWVAALVKNSTSFEKTTKDGFHRVYQYIHGANLNSSQMVITAPVLTTFSSATGATDSYVKFYMPAKFQPMPPFPMPELNLNFERWRAQCYAVRKFPGFAKDEGISKQIGALVAALNNDLSGVVQILDDRAYSFTIAQYNASSRLTGRLNEVWFNVSAFALEGCPSFR
ncbi:OLC1v1028362C1 [Oldenlandia corymbosa var. corymbosa]|uniref:OLC1v1028362C1 n=1 Tax=Oldenlandia corymbosa var. corymbosa TaxID=529605 RepID=A0AAV1CCA3_OLDCO|nr:OLC1v1028362C1 [Oldenlandia corymbosa var. corymbosa]